MIKALLLAPIIMDFPKEGRKTVSHKATSAHRRLWYFFLYFIESFILWF